MILTLLRIGLINLRRDRVAQAMTFLLPILFFSIFATVFANQRNPTRKIAVAIVDEDRTDYSRALAAALGQEGGLSIRTAPTTGGGGATFTRAQAEALVKSGDVPVAVVLPKGLAQVPRFSNGSGEPRVAIQLLADVSDPIAPQMVQGLLQKASFTAAPRRLAVEGMQLFEKYSGPLTPEQRKAFESWQAAPAEPGSPASGASDEGAALMTPVELVNVMQPDRGATGTVSFYAAGIGVMFLLFSCSGAAGTLLEEQESGTLGRLIGSRAGIGGVLVGKWLYLLLLGCVQLSVMFSWGALAFRLPLLAHLSGFAIVTVFTAAAAAAFGLLLATICRTRGQLAGLSTIIILSMSAVGGSMFPRFLMSDTMQRLGLVTFNAWALDAYLKVFWRDVPLVDLWPQLVVLASLTAAFLAVARVFARKWETA